MQIYFACFVVNCFGTAAGLLGNNRLITGLNLGLAIFNGVMFNLTYKEKE